MAGQTADPAARDYRGVVSGCTFEREHGCDVQQVAIFPLLQRLLDLLIRLGVILALQRSDAYFFVKLRAVDASRGPRLPAFRHRFAVESLVQWYRSGQDVERRLPVLSTYLGHVHVADTYTYWYLSACPEYGPGGQAIRRLLGEVIPWH